MFYREFIILTCLEVKTKGNTNHKFVVWNNTINEYGKLIKQYKKVYEREPKDNKKYSWKQKYGTKKLKVLDYQPVKLGTKSLSDENRLDIKQPTKLKQLHINEI